MSVRRAQDALEALRSPEVPGDVREWLREGLLKYHAGVPLEAALGLTDGDRKRERNEALRRAAQILDPERDLVDWERAGRLAEALRRFESSVWPRVRGTEGTTLGPFHRALFDVLQTGAPPVRSQRRIHDLLTRGFY